ncbi:MAG: hypothetical protein JXA28_14020 [Bacteroidetes bacterium]|nr:hypothetical protein [Bacteroidota bacterium]
MNDRIQELITAYLHRGSSPEQERELFEACRNDPDIADSLRRHLILSLKLRTLRDSTQVDEELHRAVGKRIDALEQAGDATTVSPAMPIPARRFTFRHVFGAAVGAAAAAALFMMLLLPRTTDSPEPNTALVASASDTVYIVRKDTVRQVRKVSVPVYIVRNESPSRTDHPEVTAVDDTPDIAEARTPYDGVEDRDDQTAATMGTDGETVTKRTADSMTEVSVRSDDTPGGERQNPLFADAHSPANADPSQKKRHYLEEYNDMLIAVESVQLTAKDRVSN